MIVLYTAADAFSPILSIALSKFGTKFLIFKSLVIVLYSVSPSHLPQDIEIIASEVSWISDIVLIMSAAFCSVSFAATSISDTFNPSDS